MHNFGTFKNWGKPTHIFILGCVIDISPPPPPKNLLLLQMAWHLFMYKKIFLFNFQHANEDVEKMILGNKCDMDDKRQVSKDRGDSVCVIFFVFPLSFIPFTFTECVFNRKM